MNCIFNAFSAGSKAELTFQEFVSGVAVLVRGSHEQKARFLFSIYDARNLGYLERDRLNRFLSVIYDDKAPREGGITRLVSKLYSGVLNAGELDPEEFTQRVVFDGKHPVTRWLDIIAASLLQGPDPHVVALDHYYNPALDIAGLTAQYGLRSDQLHQLRKRFMALVRGDGSLETLSERQWAGSLSKLVPRSMAARVFRAATDTPHRGWTVCDFTDTVCRCVRGAAKDKMQVPLFHFFAVRLPPQNLNCFWSAAPLHRLRHRPRRPAVACRGPGHARTDASAARAPERIPKLRARRGGPGLVGYIGL